MKTKSPLLLIASTMLALLLAASVFIYLNGLEQKGAKVTQYDIMVASVEIPQYTKITSEMIEKIKVVQLPADKTTYYANSADVVNKYTSERILKGEPLFKSRVLENAESNLALTLKGNNRAVSVMANLESGVSKLVKTGDHIDVLVSLPEIKDQNKIIRPDISKIILQKILVLAVDQKTGVSASDNAQANDGKAKSDAAPVENVFFLTLSVPVRDIEKLALAENIGRLKFALRPKNDNTVTPTDGVIWQELLTRAVSDSGTSTDTNTKTAANASTAAISKLKAMVQPAAVKPLKTIIPVKLVNTSATHTQYKIYVVKSGDTLMNIARVQLKDPSKYKLLQRINNLSDPSVIRPGTRIRIPVTK